MRNNVWSPPCGVSKLMLRIIYTHMKNFTYLLNQNSDKILQLRSSLLTWQNQAICLQYVQIQQKTMHHHHPNQPRQVYSCLLYTSRCV